MEGRKALKMFVYNHTFNCVFNLFIHYSLIYLFFYLFIYLFIYYTFSSWMIGSKTEIRSQSQRMTEIN